MRIRRTTAATVVYGPAKRQEYRAAVLGVVAATSGSVTVSKLFELVPSESGKRYKVNGSFTVHNGRGKSLSIPDQYEHDRYSVVPDLPDARPAVAHDYASDPDPSTGSGRRWDDGSEITRAEADHLFLYLMQQSADHKTRKRALWYYRGIRLVGWPLWFLGSAERSIRGVFGEFRN